MCHKSRGYKSELSDEAWAVVEPLLKRRGPGRPMKLDLRAVVNAILYVLRTGWSVLPAYQGHGIATRATAAMLTMLLPYSKYRYVYAYPSVDNLASNAICRKAGFSFVHEESFEYSKGHRMRCNDWRFDLFEAKL